MRYKLKNRIITPLLSAQKLKNKYAKAIDNELELMYTSYWLKNSSITSRLELDIISKKEEFK